MAGKPRLIRFSNGCSVTHSAASLALAAYENRVIRGQVKPFKSFRIEDSDGDILAGKPVRSITIPVVIQRTLKLT